MSCISSCLILVQEQAVAGLQGQLAIAVAEKKQLMDDKEKLLEEVIRL